MMLIIPVMKRAENQSATMGANRSEIYFVPNCWSMNYISFVRARKYQHNEDGDGDWDDGAVETGSWDRNAWISK